MAPSAKRPQPNEAADRRGGAGNGRLTGPCRPPGEVAKLGSGHERFIAKSEEIIVFVTSP